MRIPPVLRTVGCVSLLALTATAARANGANPPVDPCNPTGGGLRVRDGEIPELPEVPGCPTDPTPPERLPEPDLDPPAFSRVRQIDHTIVIDRPGTYNFLNEMVEWKGAGVCDGRSQGMPAIKVIASNVVIRNLGVRNAPGGIEVSGVNVRLENVTAYACLHALKVTKSASRVMISNSRFYGDEDKRSKLGVLQLEAGANNISVDSSLFANANRCVSVVGGQIVDIDNSSFVGCKTAIYANASVENRATLLGTENNGAWNGDLFLHLIDAIRGTSKGDQVFDGKHNKLEKDAHLVVNP